MEEKTNVTAIANNEEDYLSPQNRVTRVHIDYNRSAKKYKSALLGKQPKKPLYLRVFLVALCLAGFIMLPFIIADRGYFLLYGDFNVQQVSFYMHCHDAIRSGAMGWDFKTDLGANFIGSYSFYNLGSPFFWLTMLLPRAAVPYSIGPLLALKIACCATTGYAYIRRFTKDEEWALIGGLLYAFSGFSLFNIFFNHFHEPMVFFPLLLLALEMTMEDDEKLVFALAVFANCMVNYFFFVGEVLFVIIYFIIRLFSGCWKFTMKKYLTLAFEAVAGLCLSGFILMPSLETVLQNPRTNSFLTGWSGLLYGESQRYLNILESFFFPPDLPARANFTPDSGANWGSIAAYLPVFGMIGVIAFLKSRPCHWLKRVIITLMFFAFIPILNSAFVMFNQAYYARWFYMLTLMTSLATVLALTSRKTNWRSGIKWGAGITLAIALGIGLSVKQISADGAITEMGLAPYKDRFWVYVAIALIAIAATVLVIYKLRRQRDRAGAYSIAFIAVLALSAVTWIYFIAEGKTLSYDSRTYIIPYALSRGENIDMPEGEKEKAQNAEFRIDVNNGMDNIGLFWDMSSINFFHSIVPQSVMKFYPTVGVERGVASRPELSNYALRSLLSVKYLFDDAGQSNFGSTQPVSSTDLYESWQYTDPDGYIVTVEPTQADEELQGQWHESQISYSSVKYDTVMPGYTYVSTSNGFNLWENEYYIPMGFTYDSYILAEDFESFAEIERGNVMLSAMVISNEQASRHDDILQKLDIENCVVSYEQYYADCRERAQESCSYYMPDSSGFSAEITLESENLVFFSVPYDSGWTATVNGEAVEIEQVNIGFMAVRCPAGVSEIRFEYTTPWLKTGIIMSVVTLAVLLLYAAFIVRPKFLGKVLSPVWAGMDSLGSAISNRLNRPVAPHLSHDYAVRHGAEDEKGVFFPASSSDSEEDFVFGFDEEDLDRASDEQFEQERRDELEAFLSDEDDLSSDD